MKYSKEEVVELFNEAEKRCHEKGHYISFKYFLKEKGLIEEEFEVGKWYKKSDDWLICITDLSPNKSGCSAYGFYENDWNGSKNWEKSNALCLNGFKPATDKEVEEALIAHAKKLGFKEGVKFKNIEVGCIQTFEKDLYSSDGDVNVTSPESEWSAFGGHSNPYIFKDGKWAEIVEEEKEDSPSELFVKKMFKDFKKIYDEAVREGLIEQ